MDIYRLDQEYTEGQFTQTALDLVFDSYKQLPQYKGDSTERVISLTHPYKTVEEVLKEMDRTPTEIDQVLSKMNPQLRKDSSAMLKLIAKDPRAINYVHSSINNIDFKAQALRVNPKVYNHLSFDDKKLMTISSAYLDGMKQHMRPEKLVDGHTKMMQFKMQFSDTTNWEQVFSAEHYEREYLEMIRNNPHMPPGYTLTTSWAYIATAEAMASNRGELAHMLDQYAAIQHNALLNHFQSHPEIAHCDRSVVSVQSQLLNAIESKCPELSADIKREQQLYWETRRSEVDELCNKVIQGAQLQDQEIRMLKESANHIQLRVEQLKEMEKAIIRKQEEDIAYLVNDSREDVIAKEKSGSAIEVNDTLHRLDHVRTTGTHGQVYESLAYAQDKEQAHHDFIAPGSTNDKIITREVAEDRELEMDQRLAHREVIKESHVAQDKRDEEIEREAVAATEEDIEDPTQGHPAWALTIEEDEEEYEYHPWNETHTQDVVMEHKMVFPK